MSDVLAYSHERCEHCGVLIVEPPEHFRVCPNCNLFVYKRRRPDEILGDCCPAHRLMALAYGLRDGTLAEWKALVRDTIDMSIASAPLPKVVAAAKTAGRPAFGGAGVTIARKRGKR